MTHIEHKGLGRLHKPDPQDFRYLLRTVTPAVPVLPRFRYYRTGPVLDQGPFPHCVGFSWRQWLASAPLMSRNGPHAPDIYREAQKIDEWPGESYDGTSVRAGAKILTTLGFIREYRWAFDVADIRQWMLSGGGTVVLGTTWYSDMSRLDRNFFAKPTGRVQGGHAYLCVGYNDVRGEFTCLNSWGRDWGKHGRFRILGEHLQTLLDDFGEACVGTEQAVTG